MTTDSEKEVSTQGVYSLKIIIFTVAVSVLTSTLFCMSGLYFYERKVAQRVITVQIDEILRTHIKDIGSSDLPLEKKQEISDRWSKSLDHAIKTVQQGKNVVLTQNAVLTGGDDYTETVKALIEKNMAESEKH